MPSAVTLPTFSDEEILSYETLNSFAQAINARFLAGIGTSDLSWPLTAEGNLNMSVHDIVGGEQIWGIVNADNYDDLDAALTDAGAGGVVLVPPETTVGAAIGGHALGNGVSIIGAGVSSVIQMNGSANADMLRVTGGTGGGLYNLTLDGNSVAGGYSGASLTGATNYMVNNVWTKDFTGAGVKITSGMISLAIDGFNDTGSADGINCTGCQNLTVNNVRLKNYTDKGFDFNGGGSALRVLANNIHMETTGGTGISFLGSGAVGVGSGAEFHGTNIHIKGAVGTVDGMVLGATGSALDRVMLSNCTIEDATANGVTVTASRGVISGCSIDNATATGIDLNTSHSVSVSDCHFNGCADGVDIADASCDDCVVKNNTFENITGSNVLLGDNDSSQYGNGTQVGSPPATGWADGTATTVSYNNTTSAHSFTIPAYSLKVGSLLRVHTTFSNFGNAAANDARLRLNSEVVALVSLNASGGSDHVIVADILIKSATTGEAFVHQITNATPTVGHISLSSLDTTADQVLDVQLAITNDATTSATVYITTVTLHNT